MTGPLKYDGCHKSGSPSASTFTMHELSSSYRRIKQENRSAKSLFR
jgi:hypothetical protein